MFANMPTSKDLSLIAFFKKYLLLKLFMMLLIAKGQTAIVLSFNFVPVDYPLTISLLLFFFLIFFILRPRFGFAKNSFDVNISGEKERKRKKHSVSSAL